MSLKISSRKSHLARLQSYLVADALKKNNPDLKIEFNFKESLGDINLTDPLWKIPQKGVFTQDFIHDLITKKTDMVVHSWKDLPTELHPETEIVATLSRADQRDLLLVKKTHLNKIKNLKQIKLYSSSPRRFFNLEPFVKEYLPFEILDVQFDSVRGNIPTRMQKLIDTDSVDGLILAKAALDRLLNYNANEFIEVQTKIKTILSQCQWMVLPLSINPNAAAQGSLAIEIKKDNLEIKDLLKKINNTSVFLTTEKEREILKSYGGGCHQKIGASVLNHPYGYLTIVRGETESKKILNTLSLEHPSQLKIKNKFNSNEIWSAGADLHFFERVQIPWSSHRLVNKNVFLAKSLAFKEEEIQHILQANSVWTAGLQTWKKCAQQGIWINGSAEGLGEKFFRNDSTDSYLTSGATSNQWIKMSHTNGNRSLSDTDEFIPFYQLKRTSKTFPKSPYKCFYWNSSSQFLAAMEENSDLISALHCCGPGHTAEKIQQVLNHKLNIESFGNKLFVFANEEHWRNYVTQ